MLQPTSNPRNVPAAEELDELADLGAPELLAWAYDTFRNRVGFASSFGAEDMVVTDLLAQHAPGLRIFTLDTGRLHEETYELMDRVRAHYGVTIEIYAPDTRRLERLVREKGLFSFRQTVEQRKECCAIRKVEPLQRALLTLDAWVTGLRREQAITRNTLGRAEIDRANGGILKLNPLADWTQEDVWRYLRERDVPYNRLHDQGYPSIGCAPCTRAVAPGEDVRAGRWWWEAPQHKECGLHLKR